jgi:hypothetical protein
LAVRTDGPFCRTAPNGHGAIELDGLTREDGETLATDALSFSVEAGGIVG